MSKSNVVIIGGGLSGLSTALAFQKKGIPVTVYEKHSSSMLQNDTGIVLGANALKALEFLGLGDKIKEIGFSTNVCSIKADSGKLLTKLNYPSAAGVANYTFLLRSELIKILSEELSPDTIKYQKRVVSFENNGTTVQLFFEDGTSLETNYLIASDGIHSIVRKMLLPEKKLRYAGYTCWRGVIEDTPPYIERSYTETWGPRGRFGIVPLANNRVYWYALKNCEENDIKKINWTTIDLLFNFFYYHEPIQQILEKSTNIELIRNDIYDIDPLPKYQFDNVLLTGDCAHAATPNMGQGASQAIEDAIYLANCVERTRTLNEAFEQFESKRISHTKRLVEDSWRLGKVAQMETPFLCTLRNKMIQITPSALHYSRIKNLFEVDGFGY